MEYASGLSRRVKPQAFVEIENTFVDLREDVKKKFSFYDDEIDEIKRKMSLKDISDADLQASVKNCTDSVNFNKTEFSNINS